MPQTLTSLDQLARFTALKREASLTGRLVGLSLPQRDEVLAECFARFETDLALARAEASAQGTPQRLEGAAISLTDGGDTWIVHPDGQLGREYSRYDDFAGWLAQLPPQSPVDTRRPVAREALLECAYHGFWAPSATNWQPVRVLELVGPARDALCALAGWEAPAEDFPLWALLRRDHYESLLGDVLEPFGLEVTAREESIDVGIFAQTARLSAASRGLAYQEHVFGAETRAEAARVLTHELDRRLAALEGAQPPLAEREREALDTLRAMLLQGRYLPDALVAIGEPKTAIAPYPAFDALIREHSTQRVASPASEFGHGALEALWEQAKGALPEAERAWVRFADFSWHEQVPSRIGHAMFEALYGAGADPESKAGGEGGILTAVTVGNFLRHTAKSAPAYVDAHLPEGWRGLDDAALRRAAKAMPVRGEDLGRYLRERILRDGKYQLRDGWVTDGEGAPLTVPLLVRMMKSLAGTFGNFFLKFQNTHPQNAVLIADNRASDAHRVYRAVGAAAAVLTYASRAAGASSIIKTGPIDLARDPIGAILAENPDGTPQLAAVAEPLARREWLPAMTFQVGWPLAGSDVIEPGTANEHSGFEERKRDKRPPREDFTWHYLPVL